VVLGVAWAYVALRFVHSAIHLTYNKVMGVKADLDPLVTEVAQAWFNLMLGELRYQRKDTKHLRDNIDEADLILTYGATPGCQKTVRYVGAKGFPLRTQGAGHITCAKCSKVGQ